VENSSYSCLRPMNLKPYAKTILCLVGRASVHVRPRVKITIHSKIATAICDVECHMSLN